ncbi:hypothetical protein VTO73DRAFT_9063 [Trametes versicolor]
MAPTATAPAHLSRSTSMSSSADTAYSRRRRLQPVSRFTLRACDVPLVLAYLSQSAPGGIRAAISRRPRRQALTSTFGGAPQPAQRSSPMADLCTLLRSSFRGAYS